MTLHRLVIAAALAISVAGCFNPHPAPNLMCGPAESCPPGMTCGLDGVCHTEGAGFDAPVSIDAAVDAPPVACQGNQDCQTPPDRCSTAGTCNLTSHTCEFGSVDCSSMNDECNLGVCALGTGACVTMARNEGNTCGAGTSCGPFGACGDFSSVCDGSGMQTRSCTDHACRAGSCVASSRDEMASCVRNTNGATCDTPTETACNACGGFSDTDVCDNTGTHSCTCTTFACQNETCTPTSTSCTVGCTRNTNGTTCSPNSMSCTACAFSGPCDEDAPDASCTCSAFSCQSGSCARQDTSCTRACNRSTDGDFCGCQPCGSVGQPRMCAGGSCSALGICGDC
jgi:hypothetical protein